MIKQLFEFRDAVLNGRHQLEGCLDNDQTNAVLSLFDDVLGFRWEDIARDAYTAYGQTTNFKNFQGNPMPKWEDLPETIRKAWIAASQQVAFSIQEMV